MYTVKQAAEKLKKGISTVRKWCAILDCPKPGRDYIISDDFLKKLSEKINDQAGRPSSQEKTT